MTTNETWSVQPGAQALDRRNMQQAGANIHELIAQQPIFIANHADPFTIQQGFRDMTMNPALLTRTRIPPSGERTGTGPSYTMEHTRDPGSQRDDISSATMAHLNWQQQQQQMLRAHHHAMHQRVAMAGPGDIGPMRTQSTQANRWQPYPQTLQRAQLYQH